LGNKEYKYIEFRDEENKFRDMLESLVPEIGMKRKAKLTIQLPDREETK